MKKIFEYTIVSDKNSNTYGLLNKKQELVLPIRNHAISPVSPSLFMFRNGNWYGLYDISGKTVVPPILKAAFEEITITKKYEKFLERNNPQSLEIYNATQNPRDILPSDADNIYTYKYDGVHYCFERTTLFIEQLRRKYFSDFHIIATDINEKIFISWFNGDIITMGEYDDYIHIDRMEFFVLIKNNIGNIMNVTTCKWFFKEWLPKDSFTKAKDGRLSKVNIIGVDYYFDYRSPELRMI